MTVMDYVARFTELARFAYDYVATDMAKVRRFENGLKLSIRARIVGLRLQDMDSMIRTALTIERENRDDMLRLRAGDLGDSTHSGPEDHGHVRVRCHLGDGLDDSLQDRYRL